MSFTNDNTKIILAVYKSTSCDARNGPSLHCLEVGARHCLMPGSKELQQVKLSKPKMSGKQNLHVENQANTNVEAEEPFLEWAG